MFRISLCILAAATLSGAASFFLPQLFPADVRGSFYQFASQLALCTASFALLGTLRQGKAAWLYCSACGKEPSTVQFRFWLLKGRGFRAAFLHLDVQIRKLAWTILLCAPGVLLLIGGIWFKDRTNDLIRTISWIGGAVCTAIGLFFSGLIRQKYALSPILLACSPQKSVRSAVRGSCFLMDDSCLRLFLLKLSFIPWMLSCLAVFPLIYVVPYYQQTTTCMLRSILRAHTI